MKKFIYILSAMLLFAACEKSVSDPIEEIDDSIGVSVSEINLANSNSASIYVSTEGSNWTIYDAVEDGWSWLQSEWFFYDPESGNEPRSCKATYGCLDDSETEELLFFEGDWALIEKESLNILKVELPENEATESRDLAIWLKSGDNIEIITVTQSGAEE